MNGRLSEAIGDIEKESILCPFKSYTKTTLVKLLENSWNHFNSCLGCDNIWQIFDDKHGQNKLKLIRLQQKAKFG